LRQPFIEISAQWQQLNSTNQAFLQAKERSFKSGLPQLANKFLTCKAA
jgi:hypothetical protein